MLDISDFLERKNMCTPHFSNSRKIICVLKNPAPGFSNSCTKVGLQKSQIWEQLSHSKSIQPATLMILWHKWEGRSRKDSMSAIDSAQLPETFDLLWFKPFESHAFRLQSQGDKIQDFQTPAPAPDELSDDPNLTPLPTHPGMKYWYFCMGNPCRWSGPGTLLLKVLDQAPSGLAGAGPRRVLERDQGPSWLLGAIWARHHFNTLSISIQHVFHISNIMCCECRNLSIPLLDPFNPMMV